MAASSFAAYQRLQGNNADGTRTPAYSHLLDVPNYIDYLIVNLWGGGRPENHDCDPSRPNGRSSAPTESEDLLEEVAGDGRSRNEELRRDR